MPIYNVRISGNHTNTSYAVEAENEDIARMLFRQAVNGLECDDSKILVDMLALGTPQHDRATERICQRNTESRISELLESRPQSPSEQIGWATCLRMLVRDNAVDRYHRKIARGAVDVLHEMDGVPVAQLPSMPAPATRNDCLRLLRQIIDTINPNSESEGATSETETDELPEDFQSNDGKWITANYCHDRFGFEKQTLSNWATKKCIYLENERTIRRAKFPPDQPDWCYHRIDCETISDARNSSEDGE